jgi:hypothetical protein
VTDDHASEYADDADYPLVAKMTERICEDRRLTRYDAEELAWDLLKIVRGEGQ